MFPADLWPARSHENSVRGGEGRTRGLIPKVQGCYQFVIYVFSIGEALKG